LSDPPPFAGVAHRLDADGGDDLFEMLPCGYLLADKDSRITRVNRVFLEWTGYRAGQLVGKRFSDLLPIAGKIFYETHFAPALHMQGSFSEVALEIVCESGARIQTLVNAVFVAGTGTCAPVVRFAVFKAAERRQYEQGLLAARDRAEAKMFTEREQSELREQFIAVLGHDLRNPLAAIASGIQLLGKENLSDRGTSVVALMEGSIVRATALIDNVLDFARGRLGGGITLDRNSNEPLEHVLRQVVSELQSIAPTQTIATHYDLVEPIECDRMRIGQLLSNLLGNALRHGAPDEPVGVNATSSGGELTITVRNGGAPIPEHALGRLFEPFFREDNRVKQGLGLGLHIASEIARAHGGTLIARSDRTGTTFKFSMPLSPKG
jgi:sigma-B regulation protein RsbU (phosphoserine phosphatase)